MSDFKPSPGISSNYSTGFQSDDSRDDVRARLDSNLTRRRSIWGSLASRIPLISKAKLSGDDQTRKPNWRPISTGAPFLVLVILISVFFIVILQVLLLRSQRENGVLFAPNINDLPLRSTFQYLYLPTICSIIYGFVWAWIDLDVRRLEPFYQLAREEGATGRESVLIHYPVDFLASVPLKAVRFRHWSVFSASIATVLVFWGLTPTQAGIFATDTVTQNLTVSMARSTEYLSISKQRDTLSAQSAYSVMNIMWLNETLPPYMARDFVLAPFGPMINESVGSAETWTGSTQLYGVNTTCESAIPYIDKFNSSRINSTWGCSIVTPPIQTSPDEDDSKIFNTLYIGWSSDDGSASYYLDDNQSCPRNESRSFLIQWSKALVSGAQLIQMTSEEQRQHANVTTRWCRSSYFVQDVEAVVSLPEMHVLSYSARSVPRPLPTDIFNISDFEAAMSMGHERSPSRTDFPTTMWPNQQSFLINYPLSLVLLPKMAPFAFGVSQKSPEEYLDPAVLDASYQSAYRLLFSRQMTNILSSKLDRSAASTGQRQFTTQAIVLVPAFTYLAEAFLGLTVILACWLLSFSRRVSKLHSDPSTISAMMALTADDDCLLDTFKSMDKMTNENLDDLLSSRKFYLSHSRTGPTTQMFIEPLDDYKTPIMTSIEKLSNVGTNGENVVTGVQPVEFKMKTGLVFLAFQIALFIVISIFFVLISRRNGLPLPSSSRFVRQLLESYLPTATSTLIEPFWLVLNRHLCILQPFEALRRNQKRAKDSISLDYSSLPPQFTIIKAIKNGHYLLSLVCSMALLANLLAFAFSSLFKEGVSYSRQPQSYLHPFDLKFKSLNGSATPFTQVEKDAPLLQTEKGISGQFYIAMSNLTAHTPMPPWTDDNYVYMPFSTAPHQNDSNWTYRSSTSAIGAKLECQMLPENSHFEVVGGMDKNDYNVITNTASFLDVNLVDDSGKSVECVPLIGSQNQVPIAPCKDGRVGIVAAEFATGLTSSRNGSAEDTAFCRNYIAAAWIRATTFLSPSSNTTSSILNVSSYDATVVVCRPRLVFGVAELAADVDGIVNEAVSFTKSQQSLEDLFTTSSSDLVGQIHQFFPGDPDGLPQWHTDAFPSDFMNYLMERDSSNSSLLDPLLPAPSLAEAIDRLSKVYSKLFSILIGSNMDLLLEKSTDQQKQASRGWTVRPETRIFMSKPMFIISEAILILYIAVTCTLYMRRPWRILARMPTTPASIIAFFAASHAVVGLRNTTGFSRKNHEKSDGEMEPRYGFGTFVGTDGNPHIGIEKHPFLAGLSKKSRGGTSLTWSTNGSEAEDDKEGTAWWNPRRWERGTIREGGWI